MRTDASADAKHRALVLFKFPSNWNHILITKLSHDFDLASVCLLDLIKAHGLVRAVDAINRIIAEKDIDVVFIDVEFFPVVDQRFLSRIEGHVIKVMLCFDDLLMHEFNAITAADADLVLTCDPVSVLRYREEGIPSEFFVLEGDLGLYHPTGASRDIDVLFFGSLDKADRREWVEYLRQNGVAVKVIGDGATFVPFDGMADIISRSKLVLNLSKTDLTETSLAICSRQCPDYVSYKFQLKARPFMAGLCTTACISEQAPALSLIFSEEEVPTFRTKSECLVMIRKVLHDEARCEHHAQRLHEKVIGHYEDRVLMKQLCPNIVKRSDPICHAAQLPRWYRRRVAVAQRKYRRLRDWCAVL